MGFTSGSIAAGQTKQVEVTFQPQATGEQNATIQIASNADINPNNIKELSGTGTQSLLGFLPQNLDIGSVLVGQSQSAEVSILNYGLASLTITGISLTGTDASGFAITAPAEPPSPALPIEVASGESAPVSIQCTPLAAGTLSASLAVVSDSANGSPRYLELSCNGLMDEIFSHGFED